MARENSQDGASHRRADGSNGTAGRLKEEAGGLLNALADRALSAATNKVHDATGRLTDYVEGDGGPGLMAALTGAKSMAEGKGPVRSALSASFSGIKEKVSGMFGRGGKGKGGGKRKLKLTNIVEAIDVGVPVRVSYNQWTQFPDFPTFTKKVDSVDMGDDDTKVNWKAQVFWSHRAWQATILDQRPDERIVWRSTGQKGHVDGAVTFHELGPNLTRIVVVLEYHPQGMFERTGNLWRAQGRRTRLELKHFARHVMMNSALHPDEIEGWRGVIEDGEVVKDHETALREESEQGDEEARAQAGEAERPQDEELPEDEAAGEQALEGEEAPEDEEEAPEEGAEAAEHPAADDEEAGEGEQGARRRARPAPARAARGRRPASGQPQRRAESATRGGGTR
jgi:hypothetical protein